VFPTPATQHKFGMTRLKLCLPQNTLGEHIASRTLHALIALFDLAGRRFS
jgi:hypothetical protein